MHPNTFDKLASFLLELMLARMQVKKGIEREVLEICPDPCPCIRLPVPPESGFKLGSGVTSADASQDRDRAGTFRDQFRSLSLCTSPKSSGQSSKLGR
jgi:hypothetical protein